MSAQMQESKDTGRPDAAALGRLAREEGALVLAAIPAGDGARERCRALRMLAQRQPSVHFALVPTAGPGLVTDADVARYVSGLTNVEVLTAPDPVALAWLLARARVAVTDDGRLRRAAVAHGLAVLVPAGDAGDLIAATEAALADGPDPAASAVAA